MSSVPPTLTKKTDDAHELGVSAERVGQGRWDRVPNRSLADMDTQYLEEGKCCLT